MAGRAMAVASRRSGSPPSKPTRDRLLDWPMTSEIMAGSGAQHTGRVSPVRRRRDGLVDVGCSQPADALDRRLALRSRPRDRLLGASRYRQQRVLVAPRSQATVEFG